MELENVIKLINAVSESSLTSFSMEDGDTKAFRLALTEVTGQLLKKLPVLMI